MAIFDLITKYQPAGDQPKAIEKITNNILQGTSDQTLLGVTGSGKTFTMANVIANLGRPTLILAHNKTLAAQLYSEMKEFFPNNHVGYFVSFYDYYQPEAYIPHRDVFIEKDSSINEQIDTLRHQATRSLFEYRDCVIVASVSCIYGIGSPEHYSNMVLRLKIGDQIKRQKLLLKLIDLQYERNDLNLVRNKFRVSGDIIDICPSHLEDKAIRIEMFGDEIDNIIEFDPLTGELFDNINNIAIDASSHYVTPSDTINQIIPEIKEDLKIRIREFEEQKKLIEAQRINQRVTNDMEMMLETSSCKGIENYSRYLTRRPSGAPPPTLFEYLPDDALLFIDESHVSVPQIGAMYKGDLARKNNLVEYGFRLPSARDNRPLKFKEWENFKPQTIYVSATPKEYEIEKSDDKITEQIIRPTGLVDPVCQIKPSTNQVDDLIGEIQETIKKGFRIMATTLTKKMAEDLTDYLNDLNIKVVYMHSDIKTLERIEIIDKLKSGIYDVLIGVNLLREGLDIPECGLMAILDADKEGFLRNKTSLIQTIGRAARNADAKVILYANKETKSIKAAIEETNRRRKIQQDYNKKHGIIPKTILKKSNPSPFAAIYGQKEDNDQNFASKKYDLKSITKEIKQLEEKMRQAAGELDFENAANYRDKIHQLQGIKDQML